MNSQRLNELAVNITERLFDTGAVDQEATQNALAFVVANLKPVFECLESADKGGREYAILAGTNAARAEKAERERDSLQEQVRALVAENSALARYFSASSVAVNHWNSWADTEDKLALAPETPATYAFISEIRAQARAEGIHFAANRLLAAWESGFVDDTPAAAHDISGAILSAVEFLPNAFEAEFKRDYADEVRARIRAGEQP